MRRYKVLIGRRKVYHAEVQVWNNGSVLGTIFRIDESGETTSTAYYAWFHSDLDRDLRLSRWRRMQDILLKEASNEQNIDTQFMVCPECEHEQSANITAEDGDPFNTQIHWCVKCNYCIMESEWQTVQSRREELAEGCSEHDYKVVFDDFNAGVYRCAHCKSLAVYQDGNIIAAGDDKRITELEKENAKLQAAWEDAQNQAIQLSMSREKYWSALKWAMGCVIQPNRQHYDGYLAYMAMCREYREKRGNAENLIEAYHETS